MVKTGGSVFATPPGAALLPQQVQIAALHQLHAGADQANGPVAQVMRPPAGTGWNARVAKKSRRNAPLGLASKPSLKRTQRTGKPAPPRLRQPRRRAARQYA